MLRFVALFTITLMTGCIGKLAAPEEEARAVVVFPPKDFCIPWTDVLFDTCTVLSTSSTAGTFGAGSRVVCETTDVTIWTGYSGGFVRYEPLGGAGTPGQWAVGHVLCEVANDGVVLVRSPRSDSSASAGSAE